MKEIEATDEQVTLTVDQMQTVENALAEGTAAKKALDEVNNLLDSISDDIKSMNGVENKVAAVKMLLKMTPAVAPAGVNKAETHEAVNDGTDPVNKFFK